MERLLLHLSKNDDSKDNIINVVKRKESWVKPTQRIREIMLITGTKISDILLFEHQVESAAKLFEQFFRYQKRLSVIVGHKNLGKSQFMFFLFHLLEELGEYVVFLDKTIVPLQKAGTGVLVMNSLSREYCPQYWIHSFLDKLRTEPALSLDMEEISLQDILEQFSNSHALEDFRQFMWQLSLFAHKRRVWILLDEVVSMDFQCDSIPFIVLPEEQQDTPFFFIVTGSAGMGTWIGERHLEKYIFDLPLFAQGEISEYATTLLRSLGKTTSEFAEYLCVPEDGISNILEERCGGVIGYVTDMIISLAHGNSFMQFSANLYERIVALTLKASEKKSITINALSEEWLVDFQDPRSQWESIRNSGLCGKGPPRGMLFTLLLQRLLAYAPKEVDDLSIVRCCRQKFQNDPGLDGCLLELEDIIKLKRGCSLCAAFLEKKHNKWIAQLQTTFYLPPPNIKSLGMWTYYADGTLGQSSGCSIGDWHLIEVPCGFDVADVVIVFFEQQVLKIFYVQITRSDNPFRKHHTNETCSVRSKERLQQLEGEILQCFGAQNCLPETYFVMVAPNCEGGQYIPSEKQTLPYYFHPSNKVFCETIDKTKLTKRANAGEEPNRTKNLRKGCCRCCSGNCSKCACKCI